MALPPGKMATLKEVIEYIAEPLLHQAPVVQHEAATKSDASDEQKSSSVEPVTSEVTREPKPTLQTLAADVYEELFNERHYSGNDRMTVLLKLAPLSKVLNSVTIPHIYNTFSMGEDADHDRHFLEDTRTALLVRTLVGKPELGNVIKSLHLHEKHIEGWDYDRNRGNEGVKISTWVGPPPERANDAASKSQENKTSDVEKMALDKARRSSSSSSEDGRKRVDRTPDLADGDESDSYNIKVERHRANPVEAALSLELSEKFRDAQRKPSKGSFLAQDMERIEATIRKLCEQPIWRFPAGEPTDIRAWGEFANMSNIDDEGVMKLNKQPLDAPYDKDAFTEDWIRCFKDGHYDAVYALLLSLTKGATSLRLETWLTSWNINGMPPDRLVNDYISQFMRAVAQSQINALAQKGKHNGVDHYSGTDADGRLLPNLRVIEVVYGSQESNIPIALAIPFLLPPSIKSATLSGIWDPCWFPTGKYLGEFDEEGELVPGSGSDSDEVSQMHPRELPDLKHIKKLKLQKSLIGADSLGKLISCCPELEYFSYGQYKQNMVNFTGEDEPCFDIELDVRLLQPYLDLMKKTLKYFDFAVNGERDKRCWQEKTDRPDVLEIWQGYFDLSGFEKLEDVTLNCENFLDHSPKAIENSETYQDVGAILPLRTLKTLVLHNSMWAGPWDGNHRDDKADETRLKRVSQCFLNMLQQNDSLVLEKLIFIAQNDDKGVDLFDDNPPPVTKQLQRLCERRGIEFMLYWLPHESLEPTQEEMDRGLDEYTEGMLRASGWVDAGIDEVCERVRDLMYNTDSEPEEGLWVEELEEDESANEGEDNVVNIRDEGVDRGQGDVAETGDDIMMENGHDEEEDKDDELDGTGSIWSQD